MQNLKTVTESNNGNVTSYDYDGMRRVVKQTYPNGWVTENEYDSMGRVVKIWDIDPSQKNLKTIKHTYSYDAYGNMLSEYKRGNNLSKVHYKNKKETLMGSYTYDEINRMVKGVNDAGEQSYYFFNGLGVLVTNEWIIAKNNHGYHDVRKTKMTIKKSKITAYLREGLFCDRI